MLKIIKFENVYGIKKLINPERINGNCLIYAPNGAMKTSFSEGLSKIANGEYPQDVYVNPPLNAEFVIEQDGKTVDKPEKGCLNVISFPSDDIGRDIFADESLSSLVMSPSLKSKYKYVLEQINDIFSTVNGWLSSELLKEKKLTQNGFDILRKMLKPVAGYDVDVIKNIPDLSAYSTIFYSTVPYSIVFNSSTEQLFLDDGFTRKCSKYQECVNKKIDEQIFSNGFGIDQIRAVNDALIKNKFFKAGHKIVLKGKNEMGEKEFSDYVDGVINETYSSKVGLEEFDDAKKALEKNASSRKLVELISSDKRILGELSKPEEFRKKIVFSILSPHSFEIETLKNRLNDLRDDIQNIISDANKTSQVWNDVITKFNNRFFSNNLDIKITNQAEAVLGLHPACFVKKIKSTGIEATDDLIQQRFSSGEKRSLLILSLMYEVELKKDEPFTLVLDDIADSFDYKNKYAIIEFLRDISETKKNIQLIILTHNFDFFRSLKIALGPSINTNILAYQCHDGVSLSGNIGNFFDGFGYFQSWKNGGGYDDYIVCIPFVRNLAELKENGKSDECEAITKFLHYSPFIETTDFSPLKGIFDSSKVKIGKPLTVKYWKTITDSVYEKIRKPIKETDLREKEFLGLYIRLASDRFMWHKYFIKNGVDPKVSNVASQSRELYNLVSQELSVEEKEVIQTSMTIAPSFIHLNSFMYEPLIDVGPEKILDIAALLHKLNSSF